MFRLARHATLAFVLGSLLTIGSRPVLAETIVGKTRSAGWGEVKGGVGNVFYAARGGRVRGFGQMFYKCEPVGLVHFAIYEGETKNGPFNRVYENSLPDVPDRGLVSVEVDKSEQVDVKPGKFYAFVTTWNDPNNGAVVANMAFEKHPQRVPFGRSVNGITISFRGESYKPPEELKTGSFRLKTEVFQQQLK